jgi:hypothetical protein
MSDFNEPAKLSSIYKISQEESDACEAEWGKFDQAAADAAVKAEFEGAEMDSEPEVIVPAENTPDDAPPL